jgi:endo-1,4-beta-mannosidase
MNQARGNRQLPTPVNLARCARIRLLLTIAIATTALAAPFTSASFAQAPIRVEVVRTSDGWQMVRGGKPYFIKGVGGEASKQLLVQYGGNSFRTWGADRLVTELDEAQKLGLTVTAGMWLGHKRQGFDYHNTQQVKAQFEKAREIVLRYRNHPTLLMWAIGNEMEHDEPASDPAV